MALIDDWARSQEEKAAASTIRRVDDSLRDLARVLHNPRRYRQSRDEVFAVADLPGICGIFGVGLGADVLPSANQPRPDLHVRVLIDKSISHGSELWAESIARHHFKMLGIEVGLDEMSSFIPVWVVPIDPPIPQFRPGEQVYAAIGVTVEGTLGCRVEYGSDKEPVLGITTAGHVICQVSYHATTTDPIALRCEVCSAGVQGNGCTDYHCPTHGTMCSATAVVDKGQPKKTGGVVTFISPACHRASGPTMADIAVLKEPDAGQPSSFTQTARVMPLDQVSTVLQCGERGPAYVRMALATLYPSKSHAAWGEVFETSTGISTSGDSGAPVKRGDGALVGHIVGGDASNSTSFVQDIQYQLGEIGASFRQ